MTPCRRSYEIVTDFFAQDKSMESIGPVPPRFGLVDASAERWIKLIARIRDLNVNAPKGVSYKLLFAGRHGEGYHNVAEAKYGTQAWNDHWAQLNGDDVLVWGPDPLLTSIGEGQARDAEAMWKQELIANIPIPGKFYCSPLTRALQTCHITFTGVIDFDQHRPIILENCREEYGRHTCDKRQSLTYIRGKFPEFLVEESFTEEDTLHDPEVRETHDHVNERARHVLDYIFDNDQEEVISITAHSGFIRGIVTVTNHKTYPLGTGGVLPMVIRSILETDLNS